ncbi:hypothetical protein ACFQMH_22900 [Streptomyces viridiviolaceus]|uniref:Uncharacterized protein n=1 Tax=Streptomyces viridiviolaceus TaxID=68282 RepID=A0ABW2E2X3_9ACTN|nr:hypothetical protein [Streptomyces viridiviolaceus]
MQVHVGGCWNAGKQVRHQPKRGSTYPHPRRRRGGIALLR